MVLGGARWYWVVLRDTAWCCVVLRAESQIDSKICVSAIVGNGNSDTLMCCCVCLVMMCCAVHTLRHCDTAVRLRAHELVRTQGLIVCCGGKQRHDHFHSLHPSSLLYIHIMIVKIFQSQNSLIS